MDKIWSDTALIRLLATAQCGWVLGSCTLQSSPVGSAHEQGTQRLCAAVPKPLPAALPLEEEEMKYVAAVSPSKLSTVVLTHSFPAGSPRPQAVISRGTV